MFKKNSQQSETKTNYSAVKYVIELVAFFLFKIHEPKKFVNRTHKHIKSL